MHITGGPGSGKTWLAQRLGRRFGMPVYDQDGEALATLESMGYRLGDDGLDMPRLREALRHKMERFAAQDAWISEGSAITAAEALFDRADALVLMECSWAVAALRIPLRHVRAELAGNNRFPGWRRLYRFWRYAIRYHRCRNPAGLNDYGVPRNQDDLIDSLQAYASKLIVCRTKSDILALEERLSSRLDRRL